MLVYRIERGKYLNTTLSGRGAAMTAGNRWNSIGTPLVYTSANLSLAILEVAVHLNLTKSMPSDRMVVEIEIPTDIKIFEIQEAELPRNWHAKPPILETQFIGDEFIIASDAPVLKVPSSIVPLEFNFLINPGKVNMANIKVVRTFPFVFDERLSH